ncbi:MAG: hypothetical protein L6Q75_02655 [Burkholderiaceae bacterium]|nr:hypothetical protein [Burkholderiaceae bacterium]
MKRFAHRLASALRRPSAQPVVADETAPDDDQARLDACRRSEAFAEDLAELVSRQPRVLARRDLRLALRRSAGL